MKIAVLQVYNSKYQWGPMTEQINAVYCRRHGYTHIVQKDDKWIADHLGDRWLSWCYLPMLLEVMPKFDFVLKMDADAFFCDQQHPIESRLDDIHDLFATRDTVPSEWRYINAGVQGIRCSPWMFDFYRRLWQASSFANYERVPLHKWSRGDQNTINLMLLASPGFDARTRIVPSGSPLCMNTLTPGQPGGLDNFFPFVFHDVRKVNIEGWYKKLVTP